MSQTSPPAGRPGGYNRSFGGLIGAMIVMVVAVVVVWLALGLFRDEAEFERLVDEAVEEDGTVELSDGDGESTSWQVFGDEGGDTAYVRVGEQRRDPFVTIVYGSAPDEQLRGVVGSLLTRG